MNLTAFLGIQTDRNLYILIILAVVVGAALLLMKDKPARDGRSRMLGEKYRVMTPELLAAASDEELVDAVIANLHEKLNLRRPDPYKDIPPLSPGRSAVYSVWLLCHELEQDGWERFYAGPSAVFDELARDGLRLIGAERCAAVVDEVLARRPVHGESEEMAQLHADFLEAAEEEQPLALCRAYIRTNPEEFCDEAEKEE